MASPLPQGSFGEAVHEAWVVEGSSTDLPHVVPVYDGSGRAVFLDVPSETYVGLYPLPIPTPEPVLAVHQASGPGASAPVVRFAGDFNGDGFGDALIASMVSFHDAVVVLGPLLREDLDVWDDWSARIRSDSASTFVNPVMGDVDGDGTMDLLCGGPSVQDVVPSASNDPLTP